MCLAGKQIGFALHPEHFSLPVILREIEKMIAQGAEVFPFLLTSDNRTYDQSFADVQRTLEQLTGRELLPATDRSGDDEDGPDHSFDVLVIAPCTGSFLGRLLNAKASALPLSAALSHLESGKPVVIALVANGDSSDLFVNVAQIMSLHRVFLVPFGPVQKDEKRIFISRMELILDTVLFALAQKQLQPVYLEPCWLPH